MTAPPPRPSLESVATINEDGSRRFIHPTEVRGRFARWRAIFAVALTAIYVALPWIQINGNPALFLDLAHRQFHYFGLTFLGQDVWIAFFVLSGLGFCLFCVTALLGRVWCGWACPQTVFLDIARRIDRLCEGDAATRRKLHLLPRLGKRCAALPSTRSTPSSRCSSRTCCSRISSHSRASTR